MKTQKNRNFTGFTLIELLITIGIIVVLAGMVVVAINPGERLAGARDNKREVDVQAIYEAIEQYVFSNYGALPGCFEAKVSGETFDLIECEGDLVPVYLAKIPKDPICGNGETGYLVKKDAIGRSPDPEQLAKIIGST